MQYRKLIATTLLACAPALASADQVSLHSSSDLQCSVNLNHQARIGPTKLELMSENNKETLLYSLENPAELSLNGSTLPLNSSQQALLMRYQSGLHQSARDIHAITIDAIDIAIEGLGIALSTLAGEDHPDTLEFWEAASELRLQTEKRLLSAEDTYVIGNDWEGHTGLEIEKAVNELVENELGPRIEKLATASAGTIAWHALKAVFTGGRSIERDAEAAAEKAEERVEKRAEKLESYADALCQNLIALDSTETELQEQIPQFKKLDFIEITQESDE
ncbi:DUF2884 family protein [Microbulbifer aggregans]|uniref:DUF2884 family protein n=1 Tax=Microbulbifer aggregans TaxID=1769779 RepID=UPI001CFEA220|nr:DUF2884 family protein [Microbulbifer aggregans]